MTTTIDTTTPAASPDKLLRLPEVLKLYPVSRSTWYEGVKTGRYPAGVKIGMRATAWRASTIAALVADPAMAAA